MVNFALKIFENYSVDLNRPKVVYFQIETSKHLDLFCENTDFMVKNAGKIFFWKLDTFFLRTGTIFIPFGAKLVEI